VLQLIKNEKNSVCRKGIKNIWSCDCLF